MSKIMANVKEGAAKAEAKKAATTKAKKAPAAATVFPKVRVKQAYVEKGVEAATTLAEQLGVSKGRMNRWLKEWPSKGVTPKAATSTPKKKNGKASGRKVVKTTKNGRQSVAGAAS